MRRAVVGGGFRPNLPAVVTHEDARAGDRGRVEVGVKLDQHQRAGLVGLYLDGYHGGSLAELNRRRLDDVINNEFRTLGDHRQVLVHIARLPVRGIRQYQP